MEELIPLFAIFFVIGVPVMSLAARFVLRPLIQDLTQAVRGTKADEIAELKDRMARLETHLLDQGRQLDQLAEAELFRRQLEEGSERPTPTALEPAGGPGA
ncbi:MAG: hypothetical protein R3266_13880 [Gemmatimonadota bacterium]|nr:hypothetical protein [Gemmatimonadota bacterium]